MTGLKHVGKGTKPAGAGRPPKLNNERRRKFLEHYARTGLKIQAATLAGVHFATVRDHELADPLFAAQIRLAEQHQAELVDQEIRRRGELGYEQVTTTEGPDGMTVSTKTMVSDRLLLARAATISAKYAKIAEQKTEVNLAVGVGINVESMSPEARLHLRALLEMTTNDSPSVGETQAEGEEVDDGDEDGDSGSED